MASCTSGDPLYLGAFGGISKLIDQGIDGILKDIANAILTAAINLFVDVANNIPTLGDMTTISSIKSQIAWLVVGIAVASILFAAARMAIERRGQAGTTALKGLMKMILVAGGSTFVLSQLAAIGDHYTDYIYTAGVNAELQTIFSCGGTDGLTAFLLIIVGILLIIAAIIHIILLYIRLGVMVLLTATLPLAASASMTEWGSSWWRKHIAWMVAWLAFKPATGLVIYAGVVMIASRGQDQQAMRIAGCGVLLLSAISLPALLRLVVPAMGALGSSDATSAVALGAAGTAGAAASGAIRLGTGGGGGGGASSGGGGRGGPQGAAGAAGIGGAAGSAAGGGGGGRSKTSSALGGLASVLSSTAGAIDKGTSAARRVGSHANNVAQSALPGVHDESR
ncbi:hypothetical protein [Dactylosporangium sp. CA-092794]|uniref:hypothetical protein n=1 Tax=Dactylosporangium sp. CA-092794 TaxID=3239929 RepID=UPI003D93F073